MGQIKKGYQSCHGPMEEVLNSKNMSCTCTVDAMNLMEIS
jgi:hypothetical protein